MNVVGVFNLLAPKTREVRQCEQEKRFVGTIRYLEPITYSVNAVRGFSGTKLNATDVLQCEQSWKMIC